MSKLITVIAMVYLLRSDEGGRKHNVFEGYSGLLGIRGKLIDCSISLLDAEFDYIELGKESKVEISMLYHPKINEEIVVGNTFQLLEGNKEVGRGEIIQRVN